MARAFRINVGVSLIVALAYSASLSSSAWAQAEDSEEGAEDSAEDEELSDEGEEAESDDGLDAESDDGLDAESEESEPEPAPPEALEAPSDLDEASADTEAEIVSVGSRAGKRAARKSPAPVTILSGGDVAALHGGGLIAAATLRAMGPDRALVLVNGKRRHQMAEINVGEVVGKGSSGIDINGIPAAAIERIEILRDSAVAQYGPSAIAGVINIVLKERRGAEFELGAGNFYENDGNALFGLDNASISANAGFDIGDDGFVNLTLAARDRGETNRAGIATLDSTDNGRIAAIGGWWWQRGDECEQTDPFAPEDEPIPPCRKVRRLRLGNSDGQDLSLFYNAKYDVSDALELYSFGGISRRTGTAAAGIFLAERGGRTPTEVYPDGYQPELVTTIDDLAVTAGARFDLSDDWGIDASLGYGRSSFDYFVQESANVSLYYEQPDPNSTDIAGTLVTEANSGKLINSEITFNADLMGEFELLSNAPLKLALGGELRLDNFEIVEGDFASYAYGASNIVDTANPIRNQSSEPLADEVTGGIQGFPGFSPDSAVSGGRSAWGLFLEANQDVTDWWLLSAAGRFESVEFTGENITGKFATRIDLGDSISLRGSVSNGVRSPNVQQIYYNQRVTAILPKGLIETVTLGDANELRAQLGIGKLKPEKSTSFGGGVLFQPDLGASSHSVSVSVDVFQLGIKDRIAMSESVTGDPPDTPAGPSMDSMGRETFRDILESNNLGAAQFFINAIDTTTVGLDASAAWGYGAGDFGLDLAAVFNYVETRVDDGVAETALVENLDLFGPIQVSRVEKGQPRYTATLAALTSYDPIAFRVAMNYYGAVTGKNLMRIDLEEEWSGKWLTDASVSWAIMPKLLLTVGGSNIFDVFPDEWGENGSFYPELGYTYGIETLPFGTNGGSYYVNVGYTL